MVLVWHWLVAVYMTIDHESEAVLVVKTSRNLWPIFKVFMANKRVDLTGNNFPSLSGRDTINILL